MNKILLRKYAPVGLYVALVAALVAGGLLIVQREWNLPLQISLAVVVLGLAAFVLMDPERTRQALTGRQARYGSNALVMTIAFVGILVVINYLVYTNPKRLDLTESGNRTLAKETVEILKAMPEKVEAVGFFTVAMNPDTARSLLEDYKFYGDGKFDFRFVDPNNDPILAQQLNVTQDGTIVLTMGNRHEKVTYATETEMTGSLVRLMSEQVNLYFLTGHGELSPMDSGDQSLAQARQVLESKKYTVQTLNLMGDPVIPEDAGAIIIARPLKPISQQEVQLLDQFLTRGGSLIVLYEPVITTQFGEEPDPLGEYLAQKWGILYNRDIVVDYTSEQIHVALGLSYSKTHKITEKMAGMATVFQTARSVRAGVGENASPVELVSTTQNAWAETDLNAILTTGEANPDQGVDVFGPIPLAVASTSTVGEGRVVAFGDAEFATNSMYSVYGNGDMLINAIDWATEQENLINLTPKPSTQRILVQPKAVTKGVILLGSVFIPAGLVLASGIFVFVQRRRRG